MSEQVIAGVRDLLPVLRERAQDTEDARNVPEESVKALQETGFFKLLQPKPYGGFEADPVSFYTAVKLIASACGSTGWVASILGVHPWHVALFDAQAQQEVWAATRTYGCPRRTPRWARRRSSKAATGFPAAGASRPAATTARGCCSADRR